MNKLVSIACATGMGTAIAVAALSAPASAATGTAVPAKYSSCKALNKAYPGGVAKTAGAKNTKVVRGKRVKADSEYRPKVSSSLYNANKGLDRDKDNIACER